ncbi:MAG: sulfatase [Planctomycetota bacterium]
MSRKFDRRDFLAGAGLGVAGAALGPYASLLQAVEGGTERPNVLFIGADDLRCELACYGRGHVHSPNIDRLAGQGLLFRRPYVQQAVCAASRASFLTGCRPDTTGVDYPYTDQFRDEFLKSHPSLHRFFHQHGFYTRTFGKIHHGWVWDMGGLSEKHFSGKSPGSWRGYVLPENVEKPSEKQPPVEMADVPDTAYRDGQVGEEVVRTLRRAAGQEKPFFLSVGFWKPHLPFTAPKKYWDLYDRDRIDLSPNPYIPDGAAPYHPVSYELPSYGWQLCKDGEPVPEEKARLLRHAYFACVSFIDAQIGKALEELERLGMRENTVVMLWGDHGWHLGDNGCWGKHTNFERATRAPMIVSAPGMPTDGRTSDALVEYVDIFPTLCELTGLAAPGYCEGISMAPLLKEPDRRWKSAAFSQYPRGGDLEGYAIRTDRYRYIEWRHKKSGKVDEVELYDHEADPLESDSIEDEPGADELMKRLSEKLHRGWRAALPPGYSS